MDELTPAKPNRLLLRESFAMVVAHPGPLIGLSTFFLLVGVGVVFGIEPLLKFAGFIYDDAKATDRQFLIWDGVNNLAQTILITPLWAGLYGVAFAILRHDPKPERGFSAAWTRFIPIFILGILTDIVSISIDFGLRKSHMGDDQLGSILIYCAVSVPLMLSLAAIVGLNMGPFQSVVYSLKRFEEDPWLYFNYYLGALMLASVGILAFCGGIVITMPAFAVAMVLLVGGGNLPSVRKSEEDSRRNS